METTDAALSGYDALSAYVDDHCLSAPKSLGCQELKSFSSCKFAEWYWKGSC